MAMLNNQRVITWYCCISGNLNDRQRDETASPRDDGEELFLTPAAQLVPSRPSSCLFLGGNGQFDGTSELLGERYFSFKNTWMIKLMINWDETSNITNIEICLEHKPKCQGKYVYRPTCFAPKMWALWHTNFPAATDMPSQARSTVSPAEN